MVQHSYEDRAPERVMVDTHVTLEALKGRDLKGIVIEMDGAVRPNSELGKDLINRTAGDEVAGHAER
jgi:hypothetical protein